MRSVRATSDHEQQMFRRTSFSLLNGEGINAFGGSWFAVSPAGARVAPRAQPQGGGGYGNGY